MPDTLPNDPDLLKQLLLQMQSRVSLLQEENTLLRQRLFGRKSEQSVDPQSPRQTPARWVMQCGDHLQSLVNILRDRLLESPVIHCDETRL